MSPQHRRFSTLAAAVVLACAISQPVAFADGVDLRSPDTRDLALSARPSTPAIDLRSPDTRDGHRSAVAPATSQPVVSIESSQGGFDWGDAGIGAGGALAVVLLGLGAALMATHRRRGVKPPPAVVH